MVHGLCPITSLWQLLSLVRDNGPEDHSLLGWDHKSIYIKTQITVTRTLRTLYEKTDFIISLIKVCNSFKLPFHIHCRQWNHLISKYTAISIYKNTKLKMVKIWICTNYLTHEIKSWKTNGILIALFIIQILFYSFFKNIH